MGTHCYLGIEEDSGHITYSYVHYDGYIDGVGKNVVDMDRDRVAELIAGGAMRCIDATGGGTADYLSNPSEPPCEAENGADFQEEIEANVPYGYLLDTDGNWSVYITHGEHGGVWRDLRQVLKMAPKPCNSTSKPGKVTNMRTNEIIGYRVVNVNHDFFVDHGEKGDFTTDVAPTPVPRGDALRRMASFLDANPGEGLDDYDVVAVYRETTPVENVASELGDLLQSLCSRHGLNLGLSQEQIRTKIQAELAELGAYTPDVVAAIRR